MVDGVNNNSSNSEIYKKQNTTSSSNVDNSSEAWMTTAEAQFQAWFASQPTSSDDECLEYYTTDPNDLGDLNAEPSDFEKAIQITTAVTSGAAQILSALAGSGDGSTSSKPTNLESAMRACQVDNPTQADVTALNKYIEKADGKLGNKLSAEGKNGEQWKNMQNTLALNIVQQDQNIANIGTALKGIKDGTKEVEVNIDGVNETITANETAVGQNQALIKKYAGEQATGESNLHQLNDALTAANTKKDELEGTISGLDGEISNLQSQIRAINPQAPVDPGANATEEQKTKYNQDLQKYNDQKHQKEELQSQLDAKDRAKKAAEAQLNEVNGHITQLEGCIQVGTETLAQIKENRAQSEQSLDKLQDNVTGLQSKEQALSSAREQLKQQASTAQSNQADAQQARAQAEKDKQKADKELQKSEKKLDELISEKHQLDDAKRIRDAAQAKINGSTTATGSTPGSTTAAGSTPGSTTAAGSTPGSTTLPPVSTTTDTPPVSPASSTPPVSTTTDTPPVSPASSTPPVSTTIDTPPVSTGGAGNGNVLPEVVVTGSPMKAGESKQVTAKDGSTVTLTKNANGTYDITGLKDGDQKEITAKDLYKFLEY